jgi:hypothetical protein
MSKQDPNQLVLGYLWFLGYLFFLGYPLFLVLLKVPQVALLYLILLRLEHLFHQ